VYVNIISDDELAQKRQDLLNNKNTIKSENNAKRKFEAYLKAEKTMKIGLLSVTRNWTTCW
jgi:hypothetical protein